MMMMMMMMMMMTASPDMPQMRPEASHVLPDAPPSIGDVYWRRQHPPVSLGCAQMHPNCSQMRPVYWRCRLATTASPQCPSDAPSPFSAQLSAHNSLIGDDTIPQCPSDAPRCAPFIGDDSILENSDIRCQFSDIRSQKAKAEIYETALAKIYPKPTAKIYSKATAKTCQNQMSFYIYVLGIARSKYFVDIVDISK